MFEGFDPRAIRIQALRDVLKEPEEYQFRAVFRWYSKTFHTPLHLVERLPLEDVLQAYYEEQFEEMEEPELHHEIDELTQTDEERQALKQSAETKSAADDEFIKFAQQQAAQTVKSLPVTKPSAVVEPEPDIKVNFIDSNLLEEFGDQDPLGPPPKVK